MAKVSSMSSARLYTASGNGCVSVSINSPLCNHYYCLLGHALRFSNAQFRWDCSISADGEITRVQLPKVYTNDSIQVVSNVQTASLCVDVVVSIAVY